MNESGEVNSDELVKSLVKLNEWEGKMNNTYYACKLWCEYTLESLKYFKVKTTTDNL